MQADLIDCNQIMYMLPPPDYDEDPATAMLFGDAGSATLIEKSQNKNKTFFSFETISKNLWTILSKFGRFSKKSKSKIVHQNCIPRCKKKGLIERCNLAFFSVEYTKMTLSQF